MESKGLVPHSLEGKLTAQLLVRPALQSADSRPPSPFGISFLLRVSCVNYYTGEDNGGVCSVTVPAYFI